MLQHKTMVIFLKVISKYSRDDSYLNDFGLLKSIRRHPFEELVIFRIFESYGILFLF